MNIITNITVNMTIITKNNMTATITVTIITNSTANITVIATRLSELDLLSLLCQCHCYPYCTATLAVIPTIIATITAAIIANN